MPRLPQSPAVAVLLPADREWCRQVLRGVSHYAHAYGPWRFHSSLVLPHRGYWLPRGWRGQGVIAWVGVPQVRAALRGVRVPIVNIASDLRYRGPIPSVAMDYEAAGYLIGRHLLDRGLRHFASCGGPLPMASHNGLYRALDEAGLADRLHHFPDPDLWPEPPQRWRGHKRRLLAWVRRLPRPVGVLAAHHLLGRALMQVCQEQGIEVPGEVAVACDSDDPLLCEMCHPPLSAVDLGGERQGYEAAALLDRLMRGAPAPREAVFIPPVGVVARQSSDVMSLEDPEVAAALRFIREHARQPITVADVLGEVAISRSSLEERFRRLLGHTPAEEIRRLRLRRARELLSTTGLPMPEVARLAGFASAEYMSRVFREQLGLSPRQYRNRTQLHGRRAAEAPSQRRAHLLA